MADGPRLGAQLQESGVTHIPPYKELRQHPGRGITYPDFKGRDQQTIGFRPSDIINYFLYRWQPVRDGFGLVCDKNLLLAFVPRPYLRLCMSSDV